MLSLMTYERPVIVREEKGFRMDVGDAGVCRITGGAQAVTEEIPVSDARLKTAWKHNIFRTLVTFGGKEMELAIFGRG